MQKAQKNGLFVEVMNDLRVSFWPLLPTVHRMF